MNQKTSKTYLVVKRNFVRQLADGCNSLNIKQRLVRAVLICLLALAGNGVFAHGVVVSNVTLSGQDTATHFTHVKFDIAWNNSWRIFSGPSNFDACWVFVKYRLKTQTTWNHATLNWVDGTGSGDGHTEPANSDIASSNDNSSGGAYGVFIHRDAQMAQGSVNYTGAKLRWNYGVDGLVDSDSVEVCVFAIEMVHVPEGSFYAGDGTSTAIRGHFESGTSGTPLQITSENALTLGGGGAGSLGNNNAGGMSTADDFDDGTSQMLPASFPKGYNAFYCMKYEITQEQYVEFLNKLTYTQQATRTANAPNSAAGTGALINPNNSRNGIDIMTPGVSASTPAVYACNLNGNGIYNEAADGQNIACNYLTWADLAAYLDWAALRPFTELEYEKACRGTLTAVADEYAWGSTSITQATGISNSGLNNETTSNAGAKATYNNNASVQGPLRAGNFGQGVNTRLGVGATYYGIMEMSGNNWERTVTTGNVTGRAFIGIHGNGVLDATGDANTTNWPITDAIGTGFRGGNWTTSADYLRMSDRYFATTTDDTRFSPYGGRGVHVAPPIIISCEETPTLVVDVTTITGRTWMDRNLGASQVATFSADEASYGCLYQWGRGTDGHESRISGTTTTLSTTDTPGNGDFIINTFGLYDWRNPQNDNLWQGVAGINNPCPTGYRLPTEVELEAERASWVSNDLAGAFASPLKLPATGERGNNGVIFSNGTDATYWTSTISTTDARYLFITTFTGPWGAYFNFLGRAYGFSVRCIKD